MIKKQHVNKVERILQLVAIKICLDYTITTSCKKHIHYTID